MANHSSGCSEHPNESTAISESKKAMRASRSGDVSLGSGTEGNAVDHNQSRATGTS